MKKFLSHVNTVIGPAGRQKPEGDTEHYRCGFFHLRITYMSKFRHYRIFITNDLTDFERYVVVNSRRGVYSCIAFFYLLTDQGQIDFIYREYGSIQNYFDNYCMTNEYIEERKNK